MDIIVKVVFDETPALINSFAALCKALEEVASAKTVNNTVLAKPVAALAVPTAVPTVPVMTPAVPVTAPAVPVTAPAVPVAAPVVPAAPVPTAAGKQYSLDEIMKACAPLVDSGKMAALATLVQEFGVPSLQQIPPEKYGELVIKLRTLGARL